MMQHLVTTVAKIILENYNISVCCIIIFCSEVALSSHPDKDVLSYDI